jgi:hypothetical protein
VLTISSNLIFLIYYWLIFFSKFTL